MPSSAAGVGLIAGRLLAGQAPAVGGRDEARVGADVGWVGRPGPGLFQAPNNGGRAGTTHSTLPGADDARGAQGVVVVAGDPDPKAGLDGDGQGELEA